MPRDKEIKLDKIFKALGDERRRKILILLRNLPMTTGYICHLFEDLDRCSVMKHLKVLEDANVMKVKRVGKFRWNDINSSKVDSTVYS
jgi:DNA-binding transcriptional ArsR family regulator